MSKRHTVTVTNQHELALCTKECCGWWARCGIGRLGVNGPTMMHLEVIRAKK